MEVTATLPPVNGAIICRVSKLSSMLPLGVDIAISGEVIVRPSTVLTRKPFPVGAPESAPKLPQIPSSTIAVTLGEVAPTSMIPVSKSPAMEPVSSPAARVTVEREEIAIISGALLPLTMLPGPTSKSMRPSSAETKQMTLSLSITSRVLP